MTTKGPSMTDLTRLKCYRCDSQSFAFDPSTHPASERSPAGPTEFSRAVRCGSCGWLTDENSPELHGPNLEPGEERVFNGTTRTMDHLTPDGYWVGYSETEYPAGTAMNRIVGSVMPVRDWIRGKLVVRKANQKGRS